MWSATIDELEKLGAVSPEQARGSLDRLETLERNAPTSHQVARYAGLGAVTAPLVGTLGNVIRKKPGVAGRLVADKLRNVAADATTGAIGMGALPLVRGHLDRRAEIGTLKTYLKENTPPESKLAFQQSMYGPTGGFVDFHQVSSIPGPRKPRLDVAVQKTARFTDDEIPKQAGAITPSGLTPKARLASSMRIGSPKLTSPSGPSIGDIAKPKGFGQKLPGATLSM